MNVCMLSHSFYESDTRILQYTSALVGRGDTVDVIALRNQGAACFDVLQRVRVFRILKRTVSERKPLHYLFHILVFMALAALCLARRHLERRYDVVHVHSVPDFLVFAALVPKLLGARVILDIHDILPEFYASKFHAPPGSILFRSLVLCERISAAFADHVIVANELWRDRLVARSVRAGKCTAIRNYSDPKIFYPRLHRPGQRRFRVVYPGTLNWHQGVDVALRAFARIAAEIPEAEFAIYGQGTEMANLLALRDQLGLAQRVSIEGFVPVKQIAAIMAQADVAVVPKRVSSGFGDEAASTKITEFMSLGVPVIVSRTRIDSYYHDDSMVLFVEPENEEALAAALRRLWHDPELRARLAAEGLRYVQEHRWENKKVEYFRLLDSPRAALTRSAKDAAHA